MFAAHLFIAGVARIGLWLFETRGMRQRHGVTPSMVLAVTICACILGLGVGRRFPDVTNDFLTVDPGELAIVQFDSRPLGRYWNTSAVWNNRYCARHGHKYLFYSSQERCRHGSTVLADAWCKVLCMLQATVDHPGVKAFIYMDSDAVIDRLFFNISLNAILETVRQKVSWDIDKKPVVFNQDGPCYWCNRIAKAGYTTCLNSGTVAWYNHQVSIDILQGELPFSFSCYLIKEVAQNGGVRLTTRILRTLLKCELELNVITYIHNTYYCMNQKIQGVLALGTR
jgi:hypothetical protein